MKNYFIVTLLLKKKFKLYGSYDPSGDILVVQGIEQISSPNGMFDREKIKKEISLAKQNGFIVLVETRNRNYQKIAPIISLSDKGDAQRPLQDIYYEYFKSMFHSQQIDVGNRETDINAFLNRVKESFDPRSGKIIYEFKQFDNELRAIVLFVAAHIDPPKGVGHFMEVERQMNRLPEKKTKIDRMKHAIGLGMDEKADTYWEDRIAKTQANFKY